MLTEISLTEARLQQILDDISKVRICVVGDICLDVYWFADMQRSRLSRETPHHPLPVVRETYGPGACGNVIHNIAALKPRALLPVSMVSRDWRGYLLLQWMEEHGIDTSGILRRDAGLTPCYCKPMRMGISDVVYEDPRLDFENFDPISPEEEATLLTLMDRAAAQADLIAVSDQYRWGVLTPALRSRLTELAQTMPVIVDSRERVSAYTGVIVKPNELEAAEAVGLDITKKNPSNEEFAQIGRRLRQKNGSPVIVTLGSRGALWCDETGEILAPTVEAKPPVDIVGAGDTFLSAFSCAYATGASGGESLAFANLASGVTVKKIGTTGTASRNEILQKYRE